MSEKERFMSKNVFKSSAEATSLQQPRAFDTIVYGGLVVGILDMLIRLHFLRPDTGCVVRNGSGRKARLDQHPAHQTSNSRSTLVLEIPTTEVGGWFKSGHFFMTT